MSAYFFKRKGERKMSKEGKRIYDIETMTAAGKKIIIAGREYEVLPVKIEDMHYILDADSENNLFIPDKKLLESGEYPWYIIGNNIQGKRKETFIKIINKYVFYKEHPMTEELLNEHNWSLKDIAKFIYFWVQEVSE